jgi:hypothetical protein
MNPLVQTWAKWRRAIKRIEDDLTITVNDRATFGQLGELVRENASWIDAHRGGRFLDFMARQSMRRTRRTRGPRANATIVGRLGEAPMKNGRERLMVAENAPEPASAVRELAQALRAEGMGQAAMYRLFSDQQQRLSGEDPRYEAVVDTMDLIWGGPWAKGGALFDDELTSGRLRRE